MYSYRCLVFSSRCLPYIVVSFTEYNLFIKEEECTCKISANELWSKSNFTPDNLVQAFQGNTSLFLSFSLMFLFLCCVLSWSSPSSLPFLIRFLVIYTTVVELSAFRCIIFTGDSILNARIDCFRFVLRYLWNTYSAIHTIQYVYHFWISCL